MLTPGSDPVSLRPIRPPSRPQPGLRSGRLSRQGWPPSDADGVSPSPRSRFGRPCRSGRSVGLARPTLLRDSPGGRLSPLLVRPPVASSPASRQPPRLSAARTAGRTAARTRGRPSAPPQTASGGCKVSFWRTCAHNFHIVYVRFVCSLWLFCPLSPRPVGVCAKARILRGSVRQVRQRGVPQPREAAKRGARGCASGRQNALPGAPRRPPAREPEDFSIESLESVQEPTPEPDQPAPKPQARSRSRGSKAKAR